METTAEDDHRRTVNYRIGTDDNEYALHLHRDSNGVVVLQLGGTRRDCLTITIYLEESIFVKAYHKPANVAYLPYISNSDNCALEKPLTSGASLIRIAIYFIQKGYPFIDRLAFIDNSNLTCTDGKKISLLYFSFLKYQKTWYEKEFQAFLPNEPDAFTYKQLKEMYEDPALYQSEESFRASLVRYNVSEELQEKLCLLYSQHTNYKDFFLSVFQEFGKYTCFLVMPWYEKFLKQTFGANLELFTWHIPVKDVKGTVLKRAVKTRRNLSHKKFVRRSRKGPSLVRLEDV